MRITKVFSKELSRASVNADTYSSTMANIKILYRELKKDFPFIQPRDVEVVQYDSMFIKHIWGLEIVIKDPSCVPTSYSCFSKWENTMTPRILRNTKREVVKSFASESNHCLIRTKRAGNTLQMFIDFLREARKDFPLLTDEDVQLEEYAGTVHRHTVGMEWKVPKGFEVPSVYKNIEVLEMTL